MRILYATDGSRGAGIALDYLLAAPARSADVIRVLAVPALQGAALAFDGLALGGLVEAAFATAEEVAAAARDRLRERGWRAESVVRAGPAASAIAEEARSDAAALVVIGSRGLGTVSGALLGSTARWLAGRCPVPVLVVRERTALPARMLVATEREETERGVVVPRLPGDPTVRALCLDRGPHEAERILEEARATASDLIVLASPRMCEGAGLLRGSVAGDVLGRAHCPVLLATRAVS